MGLSSDVFYVKQSQNNYYLIQLTVLYILVAVINSEEEKIFEYM